MNRSDDMIKRQKAAELNDCRELVEVQSGNEYQIRKLMEQFPQYAWKYAEGITIPGYMIKIAEQVSEEFDGVRNIPTDLFPCEYFRVIDHSTPTELAIQPKRFDKTEEQLRRKMQIHYEDDQDRIRIPSCQLFPKVACAVRIENMWYRGKLENVADLSPWVYVYLVDVGMSRQVAKSDIRYLDSKFGHYPPMVARGRIRGAFIQHMDYDKVDRFRYVVKDLNYLTRCQIISTVEPYEVNMFHPKYELLNVCSFLLVPRHGLPSVEGIWPPKVIARELNRENGVESDENDDSGADSDDFIGDEEDGDDGWNFQEDSDCFLRSFSPATKVFRVVDENFQIERVESERLVFLTNDDMRQKRREIETYRKHSLKQLPEKWMVFGTSCAVLHEGILKRAAIYRINDHSLNLLLVDYGINIEIAKSEVFSLPNEEPVNSEPQLTLVSLAAFDFIHYSRVEVIRQLLPTGTLVHFERERRSKDIPTKGDLFLRDGTSVEQIVNETISDRNLDLECLDIVPFCGYTEYNRDLHRDQINLDFSYTRESSIIYKKSKLVASKF